MIRARMRSNAAWHDVCILNLSTHGLGIQSADPPERGAYVEICRGRQTVIARVAWSKGHRAGLRSQDPIFIRALINDQAPPAPPAPNGAFVERRVTPRPSSTAHDNSRIRARVIEFASFSAIAAALAFIAVSALSSALSQPMAAVRQALDTPATPGNG
jgi:hypothetical protein